MLTMSLRPIPHSSFVLSLSEPFLEFPFYWYGRAETCCREIVFQNELLIPLIGPFMSTPYSSASSQHASFPSLYLPWDFFFLSHLCSSAPTLRLSFTKPSQICSYVARSKYSPFVTSVICHLSLPLWRQAADSLSGAGLLRPFPSSRARTEGGTFIDNHMRWSEQGLLWKIDSGDYGHYSASQARCSRTRPDSSLSLILRVLIFV